jgi:hypothetical protein
MGNMFSKLFRSRKAVKSGARRRAASARPQCEALEERQLLTTLTPLQVRQYYGFDRVGFVGPTHSFQKGDGSGTTIAIVDAFDDPNIRNDLATFDANYKIPDPPSFTIVNQSGDPNNLPGTDPTLNSEQETALDVEYAHAMAPGANILLVEANDLTNANLDAAVQYAASQPGVVVVSMSWGSNSVSGGEADGRDLDSTFSQTGVTYVNSSGDNGTPGSYPAFSPNVVAVGGTTLDYSTATGYTQWGWNSNGNSSGGGVSQYESQPTYQQGVVPDSLSMDAQGNKWRTIPDAAFTADSVWVYDTYGGNGFYSQGGTSISAPMMAGLVAIVDQGRSYVGQSPYSGQDFLAALYQLPDDAFNDITTGGNGTYNCGPGYDLVTGRGTPIVPAFVAGMAGDTVQAPADMMKWAGWSAPPGEYAVALTKSNQLEVSSDGTWSVIDTNVKNFGVADVNGIQSLVYLLTDGELRARTDMSGDWSNFGPANDVASMAIDANSSLYVLSFANHGVWQLVDGQGWVNVRRANDVQSIAVDNSGSLYALSFANHGVWQYQGGRSWVNVDPANDVQSMAVDNTGTLFALSFANHGVWQYQGGQSWVNVDPANDVQSMAVDSAGSLYTLSFATHDVSRYIVGQSWSGSSWELVAPNGVIQSMAVDGTGTLYALSFANHGVYQYTGGQSWVNVAPAYDVQSMAVDKTGSLYALSFANHAVWRYDGGYSWTDVDRGFVSPITRVRVTTDDAQSMAVDNTGALYALSFADHAVRRYDGGHIWTDVDQGFVSPITYARVTIDDIQAMAVDNTGSLYALSFANHAVWRYGGGYSWTDVDRVFISPFTHVRSTIDDIQSMAVDNTGALYALSFADHAVRRYDGGHSWTDVDQTFVNPITYARVTIDDVQNMAVDNTGSLYALSFANHGVWRFSTDQTWTNVAPGDDVQSMAVDKTGSLYALSFANHAVWQYAGGQNWVDVDRVFISPITYARIPIDDVQSMAVDNTGALYALSFADHAVRRYDGGTNWTDVDRTFVSPITRVRFTMDDVQSMAVDGTGTLYALSFGNHGIWRYDGGQSWTNVRPANDVTTMVVDNTGALYVLSSADNLVYRYDAVQGWLNVTLLPVASLGLDATGALSVTFM